MDEPIARAEHQEFVRRMEDEHHRMNRRIEILEKNAEIYGKMVANVERLAVNMENMLKEQERQGERLDVLEKRPADNWHTVTRAILSGLGTTIAGAAIGALAMFLIK